MMRRIAATLVILGGTLAASSVGAQDPCAGCTIPPVWISPESRYSYRVQIVTDEGDPRFESEVRVVFPPTLCDLLVLCDTTASACETDCGGLSFAGTTNIKGWAEFHIKGGGCWNEEVVSNSAHLVHIYVDGELVRRVGVRSPDVVDGTPLFPWELWCESPPDAAGVSLVGLDDMAALTPFFKSGTYSPCADMDGDHAVGLTDVLMATDAMKAGSSCGEQ